MTTHSFAEFTFKPKTHIWSPWNLQRVAMEKSSMYDPCCSKIVSREYDVILWQVFSRVNWGQEGSRHGQTLNEGALPGKRSTPKRNLGGNWEAILISPKRCIFLLTLHFSAHRDSQRYDHLCFLPRSPKTSNEKLGMNFKSCLTFFFCFLMIWLCHATYFVYFFFRDTAMPIHLRYVCSCFFTKRAEWSSPNRERVAHKTKNSHYLALTEKVCRLLFIITLEYILTMWGRGCVN